MILTIVGVKHVQLNHGNLGVVCLGSEDATEYLALGEERYASSEHLAGRGWVCGAWYGQKMAGKLFWNGFECLGNGYAYFCTAFE